jgi:pilus assembly protein CpaE
MRACVISDLESVSAKVRQVLLRHGHECSAAQVCTLAQAPARLAETPAELAVLVLSPDTERALVLLGQARAGIQRRLLAIGPAAEPKLILRALREGADQYLDEAELEVELEGALARLRVEGDAQGEPGRLITVLAPSGGSGSSTLAANVATVLAREHKSCALFDLKLESGDLAALLDLRPTHTLADLCQNVARLDRVMFERSLTRHASGVHLLAPPRTFDDINYVTADAVRQALTLARGLFPYVVVDLDHSFREEQVQVLRQTDVLLLVLRLDFTCLRNTRRTLDYLTKLGVNSDRVRLVVNRYGQAKEVPAAKAEEALGIKIFHYVPDEPKTINLANNNGVPAVVEYPRAKVSRSVTQLAHSINGRR